MKQKKKDSQIVRATIVILVALIVVIGLLVLLKKKAENSPEEGFSTQESFSETEALGKFEDFTVSGDIIVYGDPVSTTEGEVPFSAAESTTAGTDTTTVTATTAAGTTAAGTTAAGTTAAGTTAAGTAGSDYAYAYAGFNPVPADLDIAEWNLLLVNRNYILPENYTPDLSEAVKGSGVRMDSRVSPYYQRMYDAAKADGITLTPLSGHRRISTQKTNFENKIQKYIGQGYSKAEATQLAAQIILPPGTSEHNAGIAMDIISLDVDFEETAAFRWLCDNAADYGFILRYPKDKMSITKITYEPWHWRYVGVNHAKAMKQSGQCLEEYLGKA